MDIAERLKFNGHYPGESIPSAAVRKNVERGEAIIEIDRLRAQIDAMTEALTVSTAALIAAQAQTENTAGDLQSQIREALARNRAALKTDSRYPPPVANGRTTSAALDHAR